MVKTGKHRNRNAEDRNAKKVIFFAVQRIRRGTDDDLRKHTLIQELWESDEACFNACLRCFNVTCDLLQSDLDHVCSVETDSFYLFLSCESRVEPPMRKISELFQRLTLLHEDINTPVIILQP